MDGIGALKNLEILSFSHSSMEKLPREIGQLIHLKMLDLSYSGIAVIPPDIISNLTKLEELYMGIISTKWEVENSTKQSRNATLAELRHLINLAVLEIHIQEAWILPRDLMFEKLERYKIVIGDVWEWSDKYWASKMLKIKLGTNIHLEHGIKALIKRAEDLHLDQINGISNVLYQLNGEGFPLLKHLYIQNNAEIQHIINSRDRIRPHIFFPKLETLELHNLTSLEKICYGALTDNSFGKLRVIKVKSCGQLDYLLPIPMVKALSQLVEIEVSECNSMKKIVFLESTDSGETIDKIEFCSLRSLTLRNLPTVDGFCPNILTNIPTSFFNAKVVFSNLETLKLSSINMNKIWDDDESSIAYSICNLTNMIVEDCGGLKYLFSSSMVESLLNLKRLQISRCYGMEEIIAKKGTNRTSLKEVRFIKLDTITINDMEKLETVWHYQFSGLKTLEVRKCEKLDNIFPSYVHGAFGSLETLMVSDCNSVEEIFQLSSEMQSVEDTTQLKQLTLLRLPKLKRIWSRDPQNILRFNNLQAVGVEDCEHLEYLFPLSIATSMPQLEKITIKQARRMKEIVSKKEGTMDSPVIFEFNHLTSLVLWNLDEFRGFLAGEHSLACPLLRKIDIFGCAKLQLFKTQCTSSQIEVISKHQPLFTLEEVSANLEELSLNEKDALRILNGHYGKILFHSIEILRLQCFQETPVLFLNDFLDRFLSTTTLQVRNSSFKTLFPSKEIRHCSNKSPTQIKNLWLCQLEQLEHIWNDDFLADSFVQNLEYLFIGACSSLIRLAPPLISFNNLAILEVTDCKGLIYLMTSSAAKSLVHLTDLMVNNCEMIGDVIRTDEGESEEAEMAFESLKYLKLTSLLSLKNFCSGKHTFIFPSLEGLIVTGCPKMQNFSSGVTKAPFLKLVQVENGKKRWKEDLNTTIKQLFLEKEVPDSNKS